jgi:1-acyl-sn-glycerol-3-phosphate acyltransferase
MKQLISGSVLFLVHFLSRLFYRIEWEWVGALADSPDPWVEAKNSGIRLIAFLNHTSLWEPVFAGGVPLHFLWFMAGRILVPGADSTLKRPFVGTFYKLLTPATIPISRKRDGTWDFFLSQINRQNIVMLAPEGRMMRRNGLDSKGQPMSVRGGIADILKALPSGKMILCYSGGLHHIQAPGDRFPRLFQTARIRYELVDIEAYKAELHKREEPFKIAVVRDLEARMRTHCPA